MIDHVSIGVRDLAAAAKFYEQVLATIGYAPLARHAETIGFGKTYPHFWLNARPDRAPGGDDGAHVCLRTPDPAGVDAFHTEALAAGAADDGAPGPRPEYDEGYYAAFIRDPDGNRVEVVTFLTKES